MKKSKIIIQSDANDVSTDDVISWIRFLSKKKICLFFDDFKIDNFEVALDLNNSYLKINNTKINLNDKFWHRRGLFEYPILNNDYLFSSLFANLYKQNEKTMINTINNCDFLRGSINRQVDNDVEKLQMLFFCRKIGIKVPNLLISDNRNKVLEFIKAHKKVITKSLRHASTLFRYKNHLFQVGSGTILIDESIFNQYENQFSLSLFQEYIEKKYEIRSFYLNGQFKSMAIFSQLNEKTKVDFRNYDYENPNRLTPYQLPIELEVKLKSLMENLKINSGSIDIICTPNNEYYFLEINPIGQFQWLSRNCNYNIEKLIASELCK